MNSPGYVLAVHADSSLQAMVKAAAREAGGFSMKATSATTDELQEAASGAAAVVIGIDSGSAGSLEDLGRLTRSLPERRLVAVAKHGSAEDVRHLFRAGVADVLTGTPTIGALTNSLSELVRNQALPEQGRIISVVKAVGGAGATTVGLNLASLMCKGDARQGRAPRGTAFLDLDVQFGDSDLALDLQPRTTVVDVLKAPGRLDARFLQTVMVDHQSGLRLLAPPPSMVPLDAAGSDVVPELLSNASSLFPRVIVDLPPAWTDWSLQVLKSSDLVVLLTLPTVAGALRARRVLQALRDAQLQRPIFLIINRLEGLVEKLDKSGRIGRALDRPIDATLSLDSAAARASDRGALIVDAFPAARLTKELRVLAGRVEQALNNLDQSATVPGPVMAEAFA